MRTINSYFIWHHLCTVRYCWSSGSVFCRSYHEVLIWHFADTVNWSC